MVTKNWKCVVAVAVALVVAGTAPAWGAAMLVSAEFQGTGGTNMSGNEPLAVGLDSAFSSAGTTWNQLVPANYPTTATNPSFSSLKDRGTGLATSVGFSITGGGVVSGISNAWVAGNALTRDIMIFGNWGGLSTAFDWQISGLTPNAAFKLVLYGSATTYGPTIGAYQTVDTNGDGALTESPVLVTGYNSAPPVLFTGTVGSTGLIKGHANWAGVEGDWSGFQVSVADISVADIPEPGTAVLLATGLLGVLARGRRRPS